jgi:hypothetical protein
MPEPQDPAKRTPLSVEELVRFLVLVTRVRQSLTSAERRELAALVRRLLAAPPAPLPEEFRHLVRRPPEE